MFREILRFDQGNFELHSDFRENVARCIGLTNIPDKVFCATDYHLDWIEAALHLLETDPTGDPPQIKIPSERFNQNQQDVDLLIAFPDQSNPDITHVVLVEAKAYGYWNSEQLREKTERLGEIFGTEGQKCSVVRPYFVLLTNEIPVRITDDDVEKWPRWMKNGAGTPNWLEYELPSRLRMRRCTTEGTLYNLGPEIKFDRVPKKAQRKGRQ